MLGKYTIIPATDAEALIEFMERGRVLAVATAYVGLHAELTARILLRELPQFDSVFIVPFQPEPQSRRLHKEARRQARQAYKDGIIH